MILLDFVEEIFNLKYDEQPNYDKLNFMLLLKIMEQNHQYDQIYDWNIIPNHNQDFLLSKKNLNRKFKFDRVFNKSSKAIISEKDEEESCSSDETYELKSISER